MISSASEEQTCTACEFIWTGSPECRRCTDIILIQREHEWESRIFKDFLPRGMPVLTEDEIKKIKDRKIIITLKDALRMKVKPTKPTVVSNGYKVSMSIDVMSDDLEVHHVSIYNPKGRTDPAEAEHIARDILGEGYRYIGGGELESNNLHFMKPVIKGEKKRR